MDNNEYYVYLHTNLNNGKKYVGITSQKPNKRWQNGKGYSTQHFSRAIKKYGWNGFSHEILYSGLSETQAKVMEVSLIHFYNSANPEYGYNVSLGGDVVSEETKAKMSEARSGINNHFYGKHHTEETKKKLSEARSGAKNYKSKSCICTTTGFTFGSTREAGRYYNIDNSGISSCCNGKIKSAGKLNGQKLKWKYIRDLKKPPMTEEEKQHLRDITNKFYR